MHKPSPHFPSGVFWETKCKCNNFRHRLRFIRCPLLEGKCCFQPFISLKSFGPPVWQPDEVLTSPESLSYETEAATEELLYEVWIPYCTCVCCFVVVPSSPHPVKPLTTAMLADEKRTEGRSVLATGLEKLKSTIHPGRSSQLSEQEADKKKVQHSVL